MRDVTASLQGEAAEQKDGEHIPSARLAKELLLERGGRKLEDSAAAGGCVPKKVDPVVD